MSNLVYDKREPCKEKITNQIMEVADEFRTVILEKLLWIRGKKGW